jgi:anti-anti-sigma factor
MATLWGRIAERFVDGVAILDVRGPVRLTLSDDPLSDDRCELLGKIQQLVVQGWLKILLNLAEVPYVDSGGLQEVVQGWKAAHDAGGALTLCGLAQRVRDLLHVTSLDEYIEVFDSEGEALQSLRARV